MTTAYARAYARAREGRYSRGTTSPGLQALYPPFEGFRRTPPHADMRTVASWTDSPEGGTEPFAYRPLPSRACVHRLPKPALAATLRIVIASRDGAIQGGTKVFRTITRKIRWIFRFEVLHYFERSQGRYRDLRHLEILLPRKRFARVSLNGQYRSARSEVERHRYANPGFSFGFENAYVNWTHFRRHCFHACLNIARRGVTFSYGRRIV